HDSTAPCPGIHGPTPVRVTTAAGSYCVDATEVTIAQYDAFVTAMAGNVAGQPPACAFNVTYAPRYPVDVTGHPNQAAHFIDWCDAYMFCRWANKRLCGSPNGGSTPYGQFASAAADQWFGACSRDGTRALPYGDTYVAGTCHDGKNGPQDVAGLAGCV